MQSPPVIAGARRRRDRVVVAGGLALLTAIAWAYLAYRASGVRAAMSESAMSGAGMEAMAWGPAEIGAAFGMWAVMMVAMMTPSATPIVLVLTRLARQAPVASATMFTAGYLAVWLGFAAAATGMQWALHDAALTPALGARSARLAGAVVIAAGIYQLTPLKHACLWRCRSPLGFLMSEWRPGRDGSLVMGLRHGLFCVGCCWLLMALMFVAGVMSLGAMAAIAVLILAEKVPPGGHRLGQLIGLALIALGIAFVVG